MMRSSRAILPCLFLLATAPEALAADAQVTIDNFTFSPAELTVPTGTSVVWTNRDDIPHTVTDQLDPKGTRSPPLDTGETYSRVFERRGVYRYFCSLHPRMQGTVVVQ